MPGAVPRGRQRRSGAQLKSLDLFGSFGVLSAGDPDGGTSLAGFLNDPDVNDKVDDLSIGQGTTEVSGRFGERVVALSRVAALNETRGSRSDS